MAFLTTIALGLASTAEPSVYPIPPRPFRLLVEEADFIVTARVQEADPRTKERALSKERKELGARSVVSLEIDGLVKGDPGVRSIEQVNYGWVCPAPARYEVGKRVLVFLDRSEDGGFTTHALSYGAKTVDDVALGVYLDRIRVQLAIEQMPEGESRLAAQVEWLVRCAEHSATRWEGAYELARTGDFMSYYEREKAPPDFAIHLSDGQRDRLRDALLTAQALGSGECCLEELFRNDADPRLQVWLVTQLRAHYLEAEKGSYSVASTLIERIARRDHRPEVQALAASFKAKQAYGEDGDDGKGRLEAARQLLALF